MLSPKTLALISALALPLGACSTTSPSAQEAGQAAAIVSPPTAPAAASRAGHAGVVSAADPRASAAGLAILNAGGSATDAAIAIMLALTVVEPQSSGIGGGGFYVRADVNGELVTLDGRETAPAAATPDWFLDEEGNRLGYPDAVLSGRSIGVPGNLALAAKAHEKYGKLPWADLFAPAIALARGGWDLTERGANYLERLQGRANLTPAGMALFYDEGAIPKPLGARLTNPALGDTLEDLANQGAESFYAAENAAQLAQVIAQATPSDNAMVTSDITQYQAKWRDSVCGTYREYKICGMGPPSSGATTVLAMLGQIERFDMKAMGQNSPTAWHVFAESQRLAYADRAVFLGDPEFVNVPAGITDKDYLLSRSQLIAPDLRMDDAPAGTPPEIAAIPPIGEGPAENGTSHFSVVDRDGNVVSYTSTIEGPFGSGYMFGGFYLNNELTDFSFVPERDGALVANRVQGSKRPRSSMAPTIVFDPNGNLRMAVGAAGGATIPVQVTKAIIGVIDWDLTAQEAIALPMLYSPNDRAVVEAGAGEALLREDLEALGHTLTTRSLPSKANAVEFRDGAWFGAADPRSEGIALTQ